MDLTVRLLLVAESRCDIIVPHAAAGAELNTQSPLRGSDTAVGLGAGYDVDSLHNRVGRGTRLSNHGGSSGKGALSIRAGVPNSLGQD